MGLNEEKRGAFGLGLSARVAAFKKDILVKGFTSTGLQERGIGSTTFARSTTGTYVHSTTGLITTAAINEPRIESSGLLLSPGFTQICKYSEVFDQTLSSGTWTNTRATVSSNVAGVSSMVWTQK